MDPLSESLRAQHHAHATPIATIPIAQPIHQPPTAIASSPPATTITSLNQTKLPTLVVGTVTYDTDEDDDSSDPRSRSNPYATTLSHLSTASTIPAPRPRTDFAHRASEFVASLHAPDGRIDEGIIRRYMFDYGAPEQPSGVRGLLWKLLLGYLPWDRKQWRTSLAKSRAIYQDHVNGLTANPFAGMEEKSSSSNPSSSPTSTTSSSVKTTLRFQKISAMDDPLSTASSSNSKGNSWQQYYKDNSIREEIEKDVRRTYSTFHFFNERVRPKESSPDEIRRQNAEERQKQLALEAERGRITTNLFEENNLRAATQSKDGTIPTIAKVDCATNSRQVADETHHDVIKRILFIYAKLNPTIRYVQGMNEILAPIYYVFAHNGSDLRSFDRSTGEEIKDSFATEQVSELFGVEHAEADAFFCFTSIMSNMRDRFIKSLDLAPTGVLSAIANLNSLLQRIDHQLWQHLSTIAVDPRFYSFRWLTLLLSQEFELPDVLRLWDALFAAEPEVMIGGVDLTPAVPTPPSAKSIKAAAARASSGSTTPPPPTVSEDDPTRPKLIIEFLNDVCCAILCMSRRQLLEADFSIALKLLQSAGSGLDIQRLLFKAQEIRKIRHANGGFISAKPSPSPPPPLTHLDHTDITVAQPRPGDQPQPKHAMHIALLNATAPNSGLVPVAAVAAAPHSHHSPDLSDEPSPPSPHPPPPTLTQSVTSLASGVADSASHLATGMAALMASGAQAAVPLVRTTVEAAKGAGSAGRQAVEAVVHTAASTLVASATATAATPDEIPLQGHQVTNKSDSN